MLAHLEGVMLSGGAGSKGRDLCAPGLGAPGGASLTDGRAERGLAGAVDAEAALPGDSVTPWEAGRCGRRRQGRGGAGGTRSDSRAPSS